MNDEQTSQGTAPSSSKKKHWLAWLLVLLVVGVLLLPLLHRAMPAGGPGGPGGPPGGGPGGPGGMGGANAGTSVTVSPVEQGSMDIYLNALGTVTPEHTVNVYSQVSGEVLAVNYREGQMVSKGQSLVEIDPRPYQAQLQEAMGTLKHDQAALDAARNDLKKYEIALKGNAVSQQTYDDQLGTVKQYEGTVENDEGTVAYDKVQLAYCHITAPLSGRIGLRLVDPGNTIFSGSSSTIATITQLNPMTVVFAIAEDHVPQVMQAVKHSALKVDLYDRAQLNKLTTGKLLTLDNQVDTTTGTVKLRAAFDNANNALFPNQFVNAKLEVGTLENANLIPTVAVQYNGQQAFVYVEKSDKTVALTNVTVVNADEDKTAVTGITHGQTVVTSNFDRLQDGAKVSVASAAGPAGPGPR
ncbi:efflux RND transporter periplasmic adaptor subunit [Silvibacterium dinghuense]|nr:efflux RND transporter periplasmic adaptor subunit [Silvibacterium dinghuense]GGH05612.1 transport system membrane protein [Silvibacterium dinghuense]